MAAPDAEKTEPALAIFEPDALLPAGDGRTAGRWQFPFLACSLTVGILAAVALWLTAPTPSEVERRWDGRVIRAMERGDVTEAVAIWERWQAEAPGAALAAKWPRRFFQVYRNKWSARLGDATLADRALAMCEKAVAVETDPEAARVLRKERADLWLERGALEEAAAAYAELGDILGEARALARLGRTAEAAARVDRLFAEEGVAPAALAAGVAFKLGILTEARAWEDVAALAERAEALPDLPSDTLNRVRLAAAEALFWTARSAPSPEARAAALARARGLLALPAVREAAAGDPRALYVSGEIAYAAGQHAEALAAFEASRAALRAAADDAPTPALLQMRMGDAWMRQGDGAKALSAYAAGFSAGFRGADPAPAPWAGLVEALANLDQLARSRQRQRAWDEAIAAKSLLASQSGVADRGRHLLEWAQMHLSRAEEALAAGRTLQAEEDSLRAALIYRDFLRHEPFSPDYLDVVWRIGVLLKNIGDIPEAVEVLKEFVDRGRSHPRYGDVLYEIGSLLRQMGRYGEAIEVLEINIAHNAPPIEARLREVGLSRAIYLSRLLLGDCLLARGAEGDAERAAAVYRGNLDDDGIDPASVVWRDSLHGLGRAATLLAEAAPPERRKALFEEAAATWDHFLRRYARFAAPVPETAQAAEHREGRALYRAALRQKAWVDAALERWDAVISGLEEHQRLGEEPPEGALAFLLAEAYHRQGRPTEAEGLYLRIALASDDPFRANALYRLGDLHRRAGRLDRAREAYRRAAEQAGDEEPAEADVALLARLRAADVAAALEGGR